MSARHVITSNGLPLVLNREGTPRRIHIVPRGELPNKAAGVVQVLDDESLDAILANIEADKQRMGDKWPGIYMGEEHFVYDSEKSSQAFAWIKNFEKDKDGLWAVEPELTDVGRPAIENKRFKFTSFVTDPNVPGSVEKLDGNRVRIKRIDTVGFTNYANGRHLLTPVLNRENFASPDGGAGSETNNKRKPMKSVCTMLGLSAEADEQSVAAAVSALKNRVAELEPHATENAALKNRIADFDKAEVDSLIEAKGIKTDDVRRAHIVAAITPLKNRADRVSFLDAMVIVEPETKQQTQLFQNRTSTPSASQSNDQERANKITNRATQLAATGMKFDAAFQMASREVAATK